jgi:glycosyltransferase involved in cell wall biosynthesis
MMRVALVHYWLVGNRGGEQVLEALCELYPQADIYTHVVDHATLSPRLRQHRIATTFIAKLPFASRLYQSYLPLMPMALEELDLTGYDLVISSESGPAKGVITHPNALHVCYCHSPMRYLWDQYPLYRRNAGLVSRLAMSLFMPRLRIWDVTSAARVDLFVANSTFIAQRIRKFYRREASVVFPPVDSDDLVIAPNPSRDTYLCLGQLVPYKRVDIAVEAFNRLGKPLVIVGDGPSSKSLQKLAGPNIRFRGRLPRAEIVDLLANCAGLVFPGEEDFGIVPLEAMMSGRPVVAYAAGGALDTVRHGVTGVLFPEQTPDSLAEGILHLEATRETFRPEAIRAHALRFGKDVFKSAMRATIDKALAERRSRPAMLHQIEQNAS